MTKIKLWPSLQSGATRGWRGTRRGAPGTQLRGGPERWRGEPGGACRSTRATDRADRRDLAAAVYGQRVELALFLAGVQAAVVQQHRRLHRA